MTKLSKGDHVAIIAPSGQFRSADRGLLHEAESLLTDWGLDVETLVCPDHHFYLAGPDCVRQGYLNEALTAETVRAVFCTRGGYGASRLLDDLPDAANTTRRVLVGHSDITALHLAMLSNHPDVACVHGPNVATHQLLDSTDNAEANRISLHQCLFEDVSQSIEVEFIRAGNAHGPLVGGCLSVLSSLIGTRHMPDFAGTILFLEDVGEAPYKVDRMLQHMRSGHLFDNVNGIVFGAMHKCEDPYNDLRAVIADVLSGIEVPIAFGLTSGHGPKNISIQLGAIAILDGEAGLVTLGR